MKKTSPVFIYAHADAQQCGPTPERRPSKHAKPKDCPSWLCGLVADVQLVKNPKMLLKMPKTRYIYLNKYKNLNYNFL